MVGPVNVLAPVLLGGGLGVGLYLLAAGLSGRRALPRPAAGRMGALLARRGLLRTAGTVGAAVAVLAATGWIAAAALTAAAVASAPSLLRGRGDARQTVARTEALASWAHQLRDTMAAAGGLEQAIEASAAVAPEAIAAPVRRLALRAGRQPLPQALRAFADELADPLADNIAVALSAASTSGVGDLAGLLGKLADSAQEESRVLLRVEVSRTSVRTSARIVSGVFTAYVVGLVALRRDYLTPYDSAQGQLVLVLVGGVFVAGLWALIRLSRTQSPERLFTDTRAAER